MIIKKEWRSYTKALAIWISCVAGLDFVMLLLFPGLEDTMKDMANLYNSLGSLGAAFGMDKLNIGTMDGFYGTYVGAILAVGGAMFAALLGTGVLAKEEEGHTAEYLFALPVSRRSIVVQKILAVFAILVVFDLANLLLGLLGIGFAGGKASYQEILLFHGAQLFMHLEVASVGMLISACTKRVNMGVGLGMALLMYFLDMMARVLEQISFCKYITPFYYANASDIITKGTVDGGLLAIGAAVMAACLILTVWIYDKKDLAA